MANSDVPPANRTKVIPNIGFNSIFLLTIAIVISLLIENSIFALPFFTSGKDAVIYRMWGFSIIVTFTVFTQLIFLKLLTNLDIDEGILYKSKIRFLRKMTYIIQLVLITILISCLFQVNFSSGYSKNLISISSWISFVFALFQLGLLTTHLISWIRNYMDYTVLAYAFAISMIFANLLFSLLYINYEISDDPEFISSNRNALVSFTSSTSIFSQGYNITSILSFVLIWISSAVLLRHYSRKIGRLKLWIILGIALVFFIGLFQYQILEHLREVRITHPVIFNMVYTFIINASKPIGGILAAVALWSVATKITQVKVRSYLILAAYGTMLLLTTTQAIHILSSPFPPFGIATITFMSIASYAMLVGIYYSAVYVSQDRKLRQAIYESSNMSEQLDFLKNIGRSQMESDIQKNVKQTIKKVSPSLEEESGIEADWEDNIKDYVDMLLKEKEKMKKV